MLKRILIFLIFIIMLIGCTQENGGSDDVPNSSKENETKFTTLQDVVDNAAAGDTINLADYTALKDYNATVDRALTITNGSLKNAELTVTNENVKLDRLADLSVKSSSKLTINDSKLNELLLGTNAVSRSAPAVSQVMAMVSVTKCEITKVEMLGFNSQLNITDTFTKITNITTSTKCKVVLEKGSYIDMKAPEVTGSGELVRIDMTKGMELSVLSIYSNPDKVEYNVGETFDKSGLIVMGTYFTSVEIFKNGWNGESKESVTKWEDEKDYKIGDIDLTSGGVKIVEIVSNVNKNIKCYFHIFVKSADSKPETIEISDIRVIQGKTEYKVGEMLDLSGFRVVGKYGDFEINLPYTSDPANGTVLGVDEKTITFYYNSNKIGEVTISVTKDDEPEKCTLTYNANGGSGEMKSVTGDEGAEITLAANAFTKTGYTFSEWNTKTDGSGDEYADKAKIKLTTNTTLYAQWTANTYTVKFNANGGSGDVPADIQATYDKEFALPENTFTRTGYTFAGWNTKADDSGTDYAGKSTVNNLTAENGATVTLYAKWTERGTHKISYELNGGSHSGTPTTYFKETEDVTLGTAERIGYTFGGWYESSNFSGTAVTGWNAGEKTEDVTLYAQWTANNYTVIFNANGGTGSMTTQTFTYGTPQALSENKFTKTGYDFVGWATSANGNVTYKDSQDYSISAENVTLYAIWRDIISFKKIQTVSITGSETWTPTSNVFVSGRKLEIKAFYMCDHEVTRGEYKEIMESDPSTAKAYDKDENELTGDAADNNPVNYVSWYNAIVYCNKRSIKEGLTPCYTINGSTDPDSWGDVPTSSDSKWNAAACDFEANGYRLPTEAEWEWAARGGENYTYAGSDDIAEVAWYTGNTNDTGTREVKTKTANGYGLYDMSGNVWEWCWDRWNENISSSTPATGASSGSNRCRRGGCWKYYDSSCEVAFRSSYDPDLRSIIYGLRVVRTAE